MRGKRQQNLWDKHKVNYTRFITQNNCLVGKHSYDTRGNEGTSNLMGHDEHLILQWKQERRRNQRSHGLKLEAHNRNEKGLLGVIIGWRVR